MTQQPTSNTSDSFSARSSRRQAELLLERKRQQRASSAQFLAAMLVLLMACGLALGATAEERSASAQNAQLTEESDTERVSKISNFCIFGVDDLKLRPSAARGEGERRAPARLENGDCWIDKPGQMA